jgi:transcriptional regulator with XRE-family HTH domain
VAKRSPIGTQQAQRRRARKSAANRVGTSHSAISRLESGRHKTSVETLQRVAEALGVRFVFGFESGTREAPTREIVST